MSLETLAHLLAFFVPATVWVGLIAVSAFAGPGNVESMRHTSDYAAAGAGALLAAFAGIGIADEIQTARWLLPVSAICSISSGACYVFVRALAPNNTAVRWWYFGQLAAVGLAGLALFIALIIALPVVDD